MRFNIISNLANGVGLQQDYQILRRELLIRKHTVAGVQFNAKPVVARPADVNIFLEVVTPEVFKAAPVQWVVPNPEWWFAGWDVYPWDLVLAKTRDCERIFRTKVGDRCQYLGWRARDLYTPNVERQRRFLHISGKSRFKNTSAVIHGCQQAGVPLTVIGEHTGLRRRVEDSDLIHLMNSHFCQVMPSAYEGYGHVLHEALSVGQIVVTTGAPPMNEITPALLVPSVGTTPHHAGVLHQVISFDVATVVGEVMTFSEDTIQQRGNEARAFYEREVRDFQQALDTLVGRPG